MNSHLKLTRMVICCHVFIIPNHASSKSIPGVEKFPPSLANGSTPMTTLIYIGTVEGKSYYSDTSEVRAWSDARHFCQMVANLDGLASIDTEREWDFLASVPAISDLAVWTAGKEYLTMMGWDDLAPVNPATIKRFGGSFSSVGGRCLGLRTSNVNGGMWIYSCTERMHTLCQNTTSSHM